MGLQMALRGVVRAIDQLPELEKPKIAAVEGSEAMIEAFRRLTTTFFGLLAFKLPPSADELRELQRKAVQSIEGSGQSGARPALARPPSQSRPRGLAKRDYVPLASPSSSTCACCSCRSAGRSTVSSACSAACARPRKAPSIRSCRASTTSTPTPQAIRTFEVFRDVIFDFNGHYHVAVPLYIPKDADNYEALQARGPSPRQSVLRAGRQGILDPSVSFLPPLVALRQLKRRGSKFVECYGTSRPARYQRGWDAVRSVWSETDARRPAGVQDLSLQEGRLARDDPGRRDGRRAPCRHPRAGPPGDYSAGPAGSGRPNGRAVPTPAHLPGADPAYAREPAFGRYQRYIDPDRVPHTQAMAIVPKGMCGHRCRTAH